MCEWLVIDLITFIQLSIHLITVFDNKFELNHNTESTN